MKLINETDLPCRLFTGALSENVNGGWVVGRATYSLPKTANGALVPYPDAWPVFNEPLKTEFGIFPPDGYPFRPETEIVVVGTARSAQAVRKMEVRLDVGAFSNRLLVYGDRRWIKRGTELAASDPEPFVEMGLGLENSYGGVTDYEGMDFPHPLNPEGKGFYLSVEQAAGKPLPNIERQDSPVRRWSDQPMIATWAPITNSPAWQMAEWVVERTRASKDPIENPEIIEKSRQVHMSAAAPPLLLNDIQSGDAVRVDLGSERIEFRVPPRQASLRTEIGRRRGRRSFRLAGLWIIAPKRLVVVTWIGLFKYGLRPGEDRKVILEVA